MAEYRQTLKLCQKKECTLRYVLVDNEGKGIIFAVELIKLALSKSSSCRN
ncbi:MAG: DUF1454 family protein [Candidatus Malihini olakiniferum]